MRPDPSTASANREKGTEITATTSNGHGLLAIGALAHGRPRPFHLPTIRHTYSSTESGIGGIITV